MPPITVEHQCVRFGREFVLSFHRTLRLPDDGRAYPLPPSLGRLPIRPVADLGERAPEAFRDRGGVFLVMHRREALWLGFEAAWWRPNAVKVGVGRVNALDGEPWDESLHDGRQDYLVCPPQPWLDGIKTGDDRIRQFVATTLGQGDTVEGQVSREERVGGIQVVVFEPRSGRFPDEAPEPATRTRGAWGGPAAASAPQYGLGIAAGGVMEQKVYPDPHGIATWDPNNRASLSVHILDAARYREFTGEEPPPSPVDARTYTAYGFPWFDLDDNEMGDLPAQEKLASVRSLRERDEARAGEAPPDPDSVDVPEVQVWKMKASEF